MTTEPIKAGRDSLRRVTVSSPESSEVRLHPSGAGLDEIFERVFRRLDFKRPTPQFQVRFRPFAGLRCHIRLRAEVAEVHIADVLAKAPPLVLEALAEILVAQLFHRRPSREARECYLAYVFKPAVRRRIDGARRRRGYKRLLPARGQYSDLAEIFRRLNRQFFEGKLPRLRLGWTPRDSRSILGHYDSAHRTISVSRWLDRPSVPQQVVEYLVFHEMLHVLYPITRRGQRRVVHPPEFLAAEKKFPQHEAARRWLKRKAASLGN